MIWSASEILDIAISLAVAVAATMLIMHIGNRGGSRLRDKFVKMGRLVGRPYSDFLAEVGKPGAENHVVTTEGIPVTVRQWQKMSFFVVLVFDENDICIGVSRDSSKHK